MSKPEDFKFDSRVRDRLLRSRVLSSADVQGHLERLPDLDGQYEVTDTPQPAVMPARSEVHEEPLVFDGIRRLQALADVSAPPPAPRFVAPAPTPVSSGLPAYREPEVRALGTPLRSALMESEISGVGAGAVSAALGAMAAEARNASGFGNIPSIGAYSPAITPQPVAPPAPAYTAPAYTAPVAVPAAAPVFTPAPAFSAPPTFTPAPTTEPEPPTPVTLRSEASPPITAASADEDETEEEDEDEDDTDEDESDDEETDEDESEDEETDEDESDDDDEDEDEDEESEDDASASAGDEPDREDLA